MLRRDARTRVTHPHLDVAGRSPGNLDLHEAAVREFHRVADEIGQGAGELAPVRADSDRLRWPLEPQPQPFLTRRRGRGRETFLDELGERELIVAQFLLAGIEAADLEQIGEQVRERRRGGLEATASLQKSCAVPDPLLRFLADRTGEHQALDFGSAFVDLQDALIAIEPFHDRWLAITQAAPDLDSGVGGAVCDFIAQTSVTAVDAAGFSRCSTRSATSRTV